MKVVAECSSKHNLSSQQHEQCARKDYFISCKSSIKFTETLFLTSDSRFLCPNCLKTFPTEKSLVMHLCKKQECKEAFGVDKFANIKLKNKMKSKLQCKDNFLIREITESLQQSYSNPVDPEDQIGNTNNSYSTLVQKELPNLNSTQKPLCVPQKISISTEITARFISVAECNYDYSGQIETLAFVIGFKDPSNNQITATELLFPSQTGSAANVSDEGSFGMDSLFWCNSESQTAKKYGSDRTVLVSWIHSHVRGAECGFSSVDVHTQYALQR